MSTMAATNPDVTWRDALTPLSRASRRRWTACYALLLTLLAASVVSDSLAVWRTEDAQVPLILLVAVPVVFGMLRRGTRRIAALDHPDLDERDIAARNGAYRIAFPLFALVVVAALAMLAIELPDTVRRIAVEPQVTEVKDGWFVDSEVLTGLGLWLALWAIYLPTGVLAWREPDALEAEEAGGLPEPLRDALLGLALAGGLAISLAGDSDSGTIVFVAAIALIGAIARRMGGQPLMSRERRWRVAIGIALVLIVVGLAFAFGASGGGGGEVSP